MTLLENYTLDVTILPPQLKHVTIFKEFDRLEGGDFFIIHNDHDPKPLCYQMMAERGNTFAWEYIMSGPDFWEVKITKRHINDSEETIGKIAASDYRKAQVFSKYGIDFCCGGKKSLTEVCQSKGLDIIQIEAEISEVANHVNELPYNEWPLNFLVEYIINTHHAYARKMIPELIKYADKVVCVHGAEHHELIKIQQSVYDIIGELTNHMKKEELVLFPYIVQLTKGLQPSIQGFESLQTPINMMEVEHEVVGKLFEEINTLSSNYTIPADACATYTYFYNILHEFEIDLKMHIHLENNILFPKAIGLEKS